MKIIKFGGTSVGKAQIIEQICSILREKKKQKDRYTIIISAFGGITNNLIKCAKYAAKKNKKYYLLIDNIEIKHLNVILQLLSTKNRYSTRILKYLNYLELFYDSICNITYFSNISLNKIMNFGELISSYFFNEKLKEIGFNSLWKDSRELIVINNNYEKIQVNYIESNLKIKDYFIKNNIQFIILPGFIANETEIESSSLGRGGSDYSASIFSATLQISYLEIWTDVSGIRTAHPKIVSKTFPIENISYTEAIELAYLGSKVIYPPTFIPSIKNNIPIIIRNTFSPLEMGTFIFSLYKEKNIVTGITGKKNIILLTLKRRLDVYMQNYSYLVASFINNENYHLLIDENQSFFLKKKKIIIGSKELCIIAVIINNIKNISIISKHIFSVFENNNINLYIIGSIERNIYAGVEKKDFKISMMLLHDFFFKKPFKKIYLFIFGLGNVGFKLIEQLFQQKEYLISEFYLQIKIIAICNSKGMYFDFKGINIKKLPNNLKLDVYLSIEEAINNFNNINILLHNNIFIDNTANKDIANIYNEILGKRIGIITCNKLACSSSYEEYKKLKSYSKYFKVPFFFETNVGAGLPIINTLNTLRQSGDKIYQIIAVLSGSLNFIFNNFCTKIIDLLALAQKKGLTEPDPCLDLSGIDVMRKILILIREIGNSIELEDIKQISFLPKECIKAFTQADFYKIIISNNFSFMQLHLIAKEQRKRIRFIAKYKNGEVYVVLKNLAINHNFYELKNKDNIILYTTSRYINQPLIIKGAGAGAAITATGIISNIIKAYYIYI